MCAGGVLGECFDQSKVAAKQELGGSIGGVWDDWRPTRQDRRRETGGDVCVCVCGCVWGGTIPETETAEHCIKTFPRRCHDLAVTASGGAGG